MALPQVCPVGAGAGVSGEGVPPALWPGRELPTPRAATRIPHLAWPTAVGTHSCTPWLPSPAPRACSPGLPLSPCAHSCACLLPSPGGAQASGWRVDFSSFCKQVVAACQVGRRQAGAAPQPGCAKHRGTDLGGGGDRETPRPRGRERERETF